MSLLKTHNCLTTIVPVCTVTEHLHSGWVSRVSAPMIDDKNRQSDELQIFHDVAKALTSSLDLDTVLQTILEKIAAYFKPDTWALLLLDEQTQELYYTVAVGKGCDSVNALR